MSAWPASPNETIFGWVEWYDIVKTENWNEDESPDYASLHTAGWLLEDTPHYMMIACTYTWEESKWSDIVTIPKITPVFVCPGRPVAQEESYDTTTEAEESGEDNERP